MESVYEKHIYSYFISTDLPLIYHKDSILTPSKSDVLHWHENPEFLRCTAGEGRVISSPDAVRFVPGDLICIPPNAPHSICSLTENTLCYDCMILDMDFCKKNGIGSDMTFNLLIRDAVTTDLFDRAAGACSEKDNDLKVLKTRTQVLNFLLDLAAHHRAPTGRIPEISGVEEIKKTVIYIREHYQNPISLQEAADVAGFSTYYFSHKFKKITGTSFVVFLNTVRCENAVDIFRHGGSVTEACFSCGFKDISYFSRIFSKIMGCSPSDMIRSVKEK